MQDERQERVKNNSQVFGQTNRKNEFDNEMVKNEKCINKTLRGGDQELSFRYEEFRCLMNIYMEMSGWQLDTDQVQERGIHRDTNL